MVFTCGICNEKYFFYLKNDKLDSIKEVEMYIHFECVNCKESESYYYKKVG